MPAARQRRCGDRRRQADAWPEYALVFTGRLLVTLIYLRAGLAHEALGVTCQVGSSTIKTTTISDGQGRTLWCGRRGRAGCTARPRCAPRASPSSSGSAHA